MGLTPTTPYWSICNPFGDTKTNTDTSTYSSFFQTPTTPTLNTMLNKETIKIKYLPGSPHLEQIDKGDWIDLYCYEDVTLKKGERAYISQGVAMKLPEGYEAIMASRSSTFKRWGLLQTNAIGIIDNSFAGNDDVWMYPAYATRDVTIPKGTRICQFRIQPIQPKIVFEEVSNLGESRGGLGSTGA